MKKLSYRLFILSLFISIGAYAHCGTCNSSDICWDDCSDNSYVGVCDGYPYLTYRSQGRNAAREITGWQEFINQYCQEDTYSALYVALEYTRSFKPEHIAHYLFGCDLDCCNTLLIQGSEISNKSPRAWLAEYFGLPQDFASKITFCPRIQNVIVDIDFYLGFKEKYFFKLQAPITWSRWELNMREDVQIFGENEYLPGYMAAGAIERDQLPANFTDAMSGTITWGDMKEEIQFGRITKCKQTTTRLADLRASLGWDFRQDEDYHLGVFAQVAAPTGNRPRALYLFEPIVGNGKHWELGAGLTGSWIFWRSDEYCDRYMGLWLDATISHLFKTHQCRSFDFCCRPNSRYMLLEEMGPNDDEINIAPDARTEENQIVADYQYQKSLIPAINWSTFNVDVKINYQIDIALKLAYVRENLSFDLGYNLWARAGEKFSCDCCNGSVTNKKYAIKGDAFVYGYDEGDITKPYALSATQSTASIYGGTNNPLKPGEDLASTNPRVDNPTDSRPGYLTWIGDSVQLTDVGPGELPVNTSVQPVLASRNMLNLGKSPKALTHKIFGSISYAWKDKEACWIPFFGVGAEVEFAQKSQCDDCCRTCCKTCCNSCCDSCTDSCGACCSTPCGSCCDGSKRAGVYQFGVWAKSGFSFD